MKDAYNQRCTALTACVGEKLRAANACFEAKMHCLPACTDAAPTYYSRHYYVQEELEQKKNAIKAFAGSERAKLQQEYTIDKTALDAAGKKRIAAVIKCLQVRLAQLVTKVKKMISLESEAYRVSYAEHEAKFQTAHRALMTESKRVIDSVKAHVKHESDLVCYFKNKIEQYDAALLANINELSAQLAVLRAQARRASLCGEQKRALDCQVEVTVANLDALECSRQAIKKMKDQIRCFIPRCSTYNEIAAYEPAQPADWQATQINELYSPEISLDIISQSDCECTQLEWITEDHFNCRDNLIVQAAIDLKTLQLEIENVTAVHAAVGSGIADYKAAGAKLEVALKKVSNAFANNVFDVTGTGPEDLVADVNAALAHLDTLASATSAANAKTELNDANSDAGNADAHAKDILDVSMIQTISGVVGSAGTTTVLVVADWSQVANLRIGAVISSSPDAANNIYVTAMNPSTKEVTVSAAVASAAATFEFKQSAGPCAGGKARSMLDIDVAKLATLRKAVAAAKVYQVSSSEGQTVAQVDEAANKAANVLAANNAGYSWTVLKPLSAAIAAAATAVAGSSAATTWIKDATDLANEWYLLAVADPQNCCNPLALKDDVIAKAVAANTSDLDTAITGTGSAGNTGIQLETGAIDTATADETSYAEYLKVIKNAESILATFADVNGTINSLRAQVCGQC